MTVVTDSPARPARGHPARIGRPAIGALGVLALSLGTLQGAMVGALPLSFILVRKNFQEGQTQVAVGVVLLPTPAEAPSAVPGRRSRPGAGGGAAP